MREICARKKCCGCSACVQACPAGCIALVEDAEGFLCPEIDQAKCINCGKCKRVCPIVNDRPKRKPVAEYAYRTKDRELLRKTSSGGFFSLAATKVLERGGVVFGAAFNDQHEVVHKYVDSIEELDTLRRSKYVQSHTGTSFVDCKRFLDSGRLVLFCGTPCQVKALNLFLGRSYDNLVSIDFVCHGVPSPGVFKRYLNELAQNKQRAIGELHAINFRDKSLNYSYSFAFAFAQDHFVESPRENIFLRGFLSDLYLRQSCYCCRAKGFTSGADYTMCDFWGLQKVLPRFPLADIPGVSQVFVLHDKLSLFTQDESKADVQQVNVNMRNTIPCLAYKSTPATRRRERFFCRYRNGEPICEIVSALSDMSYFEMAVRQPRAFAGMILRRIGLR